MAGRVGMAVGRIAQLTSRCSGRRELSSCASTGEAMVRAERRGPFSPCSRVRRAFNGSTDCSAAVGVRWAHGSGRDDVACASTQSSPRSAVSSHPQSLARQFSDRRLLGWSQAQVFEMVADIDAYDEFLPWCSSSRVITKREGGCTAEIAVGFPPVHERYVSEVTFDPSMHTIRAVASKSELFKELVNTWRFAPGPAHSPVGATTWVDVSVSYEFRNPVHALLAAAAFDEVARQMIRAFEKRAAVLYGPPTALKR